MASSEASDLVAVGAKYLERRDFHAALDHFRRCTKLFPKAQDGWLGLGKAYVAAGDLEQAIPCLEESWRQAGDEREALYLLFLSEAILGRYRRAAEILGHIEDEHFLACIEPLCSVVRFISRRGFRRYFAPIRLVWTPEKHRILRTVLHMMVLFPNRLTYRIAANVLWVMRQQRLPDEGFEIIIRDRMRFLRAGGTRNLERLAYLLLWDGRLEEAAAVSLEAEAAAPNRPVFPLFLGHSSFKGQRHSDASGNYRRAVEKAGNACYEKLHWAASLLWQGKAKDAQSVFERLARDAPNNPLARFFAEIPEDTLTALPDSRCISSSWDLPTLALHQEEIPEFRADQVRWGPALFWANLPKERFWRRERRRHAPILEQRRDSPCPACGSGRIEPFLTNRANGMTLGRCTDCGHIFASPLPTPESLTPLYDPEYFEAWDRYAKHVVERTMAGKPVASWPIYENWLAWMSEVDWKRWEEGRGGGRNVLDVGCASGAALIAFRNRGWRVMGQEIAAHYKSYYRQLNMPFWSQPIRDMELEAESLDLCTMTHVIEHLADPAESVARIAGWLKPGGRLLVMTPCCGTATTWLGGKCWYYMTEHVQFFVPRSLRTLAERFGLETLYWRTRVGVRFETPLRSWRAYRIGGSLEALLEKSGQGDVIEIVFQKPDRGSTEKQPTPRWLS